VKNRDGIQSLILIVALVVVSVSVASGQECRWGMYFDTYSESNCDTSAVGTPVDVYIVAHLDDTIATVSGWQGTRLDTGPLFVTGTVFPNSGVNFGSGQDFLVGYPTPLTAADSVVLATMSVLATGPSGLFMVGYEYDAYPIFIETSSGPFIDLLPKYGAYDAPAVVFGDMPCPVLNSGEGSVQVFDKSWSTLKEMFRQ